MTELTAAPHRARIFSRIEIFVIVALAIVPLFMSFPYRVNIFLSWEGAYRMSEGQIPYKDFGMPLGYMYWVIPAIFFKIFGAYLITLVKAQVLINLISGFAFRSILKSLGLHPGTRLLSVIVYCISFSFFNFWPWYNHTVIVYEMVGLAFLFRYVFAPRKNWLHLSLSALFIFFSFFTKQDGGGLALLLSIAILAHYCFYEKNWKPFFIFILSFGVVAFAIIAPLLQYNFAYWFNHGQPPHTARISLYDIVDEFFYNSQWIKFYLFIILLIVVARYKNWKDFIADKKGSLFLLLTLGILAEAAILQVTSYTPPDNNIFFHSFAFAFIISALAQYFHLDMMKTKVILITCFGMFLWWSGVFWKYIQRVFPLSPSTAVVSNTGENIVNRKTYMIPQGQQEIPMSEWGTTGLKAFQKIKMPRETIEGITRLERKYSRTISGIPMSSWKVLNMTELTPLAKEIPFELERGPGIPLWYHLGVGMFNRQAQEYEQKIASKHYDFVLFENIPSLNNFYPFRIRNILQQYYKKTDSFPAPRRGETLGLIEVYEK